MKLNTKYISWIISGLVLMIMSYVGVNHYASSSKPRISIITSVWNGDQFIEGFLKDITAQTIFNKSELVLINANSPGHEDEVIQKYLQKHANIKYLKLSQDPGLYSVWNLAIKMASADVIMNANIDDRSRPDALEVHLKALDENPNVDLVYAGYLVTNNPNETYEKNTYRWISEAVPFAPSSMGYCLPGPRPMWRKSMHERWGYFNEHLKSAGDWEMWLRAVSHGSNFKDLKEVTTLFYDNPEGISSSRNREKSFHRHLEEHLVSYNYNYLWKNKN